MERQANYALVGAISTLLLIAGVTWHLLRVGLARCDADLRAWYDRNQGLKSVE